MDASELRFPRLQDKTVLITGASSGIGAAAALIFARSGCNLVLTARRSAELEAVARACRETAPAAYVQALVFDVANKEAIASVQQQLHEQVKNVDILVNNAGFGYGADKVGEIPDDVIQQMFETNVLGLMRLTQVFVRHFKARGSGHIINLGSMAGVEAYPGASLYCATKFAVHAFTTSLRKELIGTPIRVSEVQPGLTNTNFSMVRFVGNQEAANEVYRGITPLTSEDVAEEIVWIASRPERVNIADVLIYPNAMAGPAYIHRGAQS